MAVRVDCILFDSKRSLEYAGVLEDICEGGVGFTVTGNEPPDKGDICTIQFFDTLHITSDNFVIVEPIVISNVMPVESGYRIGATFVGKLSEQSLRYIRLLSACLLMNKNNAQK